MYYNLDERYAMAIVNFVVCIIVFCICVCRSTLSDKDVLLRVRLKFVLLGPSALMFGISPIWDDWPGWASSIFSASVAISLMAESFQWKHGPPASVKLETMPSELAKDL